MTAKNAASEYATVNVPIAEVVPYVRNPRKNTDAVAKVAASIREFGFRQPIVCDADMVVIAGHTRLQAAQSLGLKTVPVHIARGLSTAQATAYRLADNRTGQDATWDSDLLGVELKALVGLDFDLALTGFNPDELTKLFGNNTNNNAETNLIGGMTYEVIVLCQNEYDQASLCTELEARGKKCRLLTL